MATPARTATSSGKTTGSAASLTISHTATTDPLIVMLSAWQQNISTVAYGGTALTRGGHLTTGNHRLEWWYLAAPSSGTANLVITPAASTWITAAVYNISGIPTTGGIISAFDWATATGSSTTPSVVATSRTGDLVIDLVAEDTNNQTYTVGAGQTKIYGQDSLANTDEKSAGSEEAGAASVTMSWTLGSSGGWAIQALSLPDASTATTTRISQVIAEIANEGSSENRLSQVVTEIANEGSSENRLSQVVVEMAIPTAPSGQRISQLVVEPLNTGYHENRYSQLVVEILYEAIDPPTGFPALTLFI